MTNNVGQRLLGHAPMYALNEEILDNVLGAMLDAEGMHDETQYPLLMTAIKREVEKRIENYWQWRVDRLERELKESKR